MNVTGSTADLAVVLVGAGRNTTLPVPEHGTVMLVGIGFGTKKLVKLARIVVVAAGARAAPIFFPALPVNPVSKVEVGCAVCTSIVWPGADRDRVLRPHRGGCRRGDGQPRSGSD